MKNQFIYTKKDLIRIFRKIGIDKGMNLIVHSSLSSLGYVVNGANDVIDALLETIGKDGTLMMPSHTGDKTDPADWKNPPLYASLRPPPKTRSHCGALPPSPRMLWLR